MYNRCHREAGKATADKYATSIICYVLWQGIVRTIMYIVNVIVEYNKVGIQE